jgi:hypothetical protein
MISQREMGEACKKETNKYTLLFDNLIFMSW